MIGPEIRGLPADRYDHHRGEAVQGDGQMLTRTKTRRRGEPRGVWAVKLGKVHYLRSSMRLRNVLAYLAYLRYLRTVQYLGHFWYALRKEAAKT